MPRRYGAFGCDGVRCRLMGGFYPMPARETGRRSRAAAQESRVARAGRTRVSLRLPPGLALVRRTGGRSSTTAADRSTVSGDDVRYPTIVTDEVLRPATLTIGAHTVTYLHRRPRPPPSNDQPMPYVREDIAGLVLETARQALDARRRRPACRATCR